MLDWSKLIGAKGFDLFTRDDLLRFSHPFGILLSSTTHNMLNILLNRLLTLQFLTTPLRDRRHQPNHRYRMHRIIRTLLNLFSLNQLHLWFILLHRFRFLLLWINVFYLNGINDIFILFWFLTDSIITIIFYIRITTFIIKIIFNVHLWWLGFCIKKYFFFMVELKIFRILDTGRCLELERCFRIWVCDGDWVYWWYLKKVILLLTAEICLYWLLLE